MSTRDFSHLLIESGPSPRRERKRFLLSILASSALNIVAWAILSADLSVPHDADVEGPRERLTVSSTSVRIERRTVPKAQHSSSTSSQTALLAPPQPASLSLPRSWTKQDFGYLSATDTTTWLDRTKQSGNWVPRVFLWQRKAEERYMRRPSLQDTVEQILASLRAEDAKVYVSRAQRVCGGQRPGWFLSYVKPSDDPPLHFDETLYMAAGTIYRSTYIRAVDQPEDRKTREALNTLCWP